MLSLEGTLLPHATTTRLMVPRELDSDREPQKPPFLPTHLGFSPTTPADPPHLRETLEKGNVLSLLMKCIVLF